MGLLLLLLLWEGCLGQDPFYYRDHQFSYSVEDNSSGNQFGHSQTSHAGDTAGAYHVLLPDGRLQTVEYTVRRHDGFQAVVQYRGAPSPPRSVYRPVDSPAYSRPTPPRPRPPARPLSPRPPARPYFTAFQSRAGVPAPATHAPPAPAPAIHAPAPPIHASAPAIHPPAPAPPARAPVTHALPPAPAHHYYRPAATAPRPTVYRPVSYQPLSYKPAPVTRYDPHVHNLLVAAPVHHRHTIAMPVVRPAAPPDRRPEPILRRQDPYLMTEEELRKHDFSGPFWYPQHRKILRKSRKEDPEAEATSHNQLY